MNVLFVTIAWTQKGSTNLYTDLLGEFKNNGHNVFVLHGGSTRIVGPSTLEKEENITVVRVKTGKIAKTNPVRKFISLLMLGKKLNHALNKHIASVSFDLILFATPPITLSRFLEKIKKKDNAKFYLLLKDIWPYGMVDLGVIKNKGLVWRYFRWHEKRIYRIADHIGCMSPMGVDFVLKHNPDISPNKVEVCPNAAIIPQTPYKEDITIREKFQIPVDTTVFLFSGNLGKGHGLEFLVRNIIDLSEYNKAFFLIGGSGTHYQKLKVALDTAKVSNALLYNYLPQEDFERLITTCNIGLILLDKAYSYPQFPSRLLAYLKNKMAVLCAVNEQTDIGKIVEDNSCGFSVLHGDDEGFQKYVKQMSEASHLVQSMGEKGWELLKEQYDVRDAYSTIMDHYKD